MKEYSRDDIDRIVRTIDDVVSQLRTKASDIRNKGIGNYTKGDIYKMGSRLQDLSDGI